MSFLDFSEAIRYYWICPSKRLKTVLAFQKGSGSMCFYGYAVKRRSDLS